MKNEEGLLDSLTYRQNTMADWQSCLLKDQTSQMQMKLWQFWVWTPLSSNPLKMWIYSKQTKIIFAYCSPLRLKFEEKICFQNAKNAVNWKVWKEHFVDPGQVSHDGKSPDDHRWGGGATVAQNLQHQHHWVHLWCQILIYKILQYK